MAKSKSKRRVEAKNRREGKKILMIVAIATLILMILLYLSN